MLLRYEMMILLLVSKGRPRPGPCCPGQNIIWAYLYKLPIGCQILLMPTFQDTICVGVSKACYPNEGSADQSQVNILPSLNNVTIPYESKIPGP